MSRLRDLLGPAGGDGGEEIPPPPAVVPAGNRAPDSTAAVQPAAAGRAGDRSARPLHVARAELMLAGPAHRPLRMVSGDPLLGIASAVADLRPELGERVDVCLDLLPLTPARVAHLARQADGSSGWARNTACGLLSVVGDIARTLGEVAVDLAADLLPGGQEARRDARRTSPSRSSGPVQRTRRVVNKLETAEAVFWLQMLLRCQSEVPGRAEMFLRRLIGAFDVFAGENRFRVRGPRLLGVHVGADSILYRRQFDRRFASGLVCPRSNTIVTSSEIAGLLTPPTRHCTSPAVVRIPGWVPPAPRGLPTYTGQSNLVRLGYVTGLDGEQRLVGIPLDELLFSARFGMTGFGKTEQALGQAIDMARNGMGLWFLDPHADGWRRAKPYLADPDLRSRLWEIDLTVRDPNARLAGWNPLSMEGFVPEHIEDRVDAVVTSFAATLNWGDHAPRAKSILTKACETLCQLALRLQPQTAPTIFQLITLLDDEDWRGEVVRHLPRLLQRYWTYSFPKIAGEATSVITNLVNRIQASPSLSAFLGASRSSYDVRHAMDTGKIVFVCPPGGGESSRLVTGFLIYDLFRAGRSRADLPPERRRRFDAFVDELAAVDGASRGHLAAILEQLRKFKVALHAMNQMPDRLTTDTRRALFQNQTLLMSSAAGNDGARSVAREFGPAITVDTITALERYTHVVTVQLGGARTTPFLVRGLHVETEYAEHHHPEWLPLVDQALDANLGRRPIRDTLAELETLDERILDALQERRSSEREQSRRGVAGRGSGRAVDLAPSTED